jgi:protein ImuB
VSSHPNWERIKLCSIEHVSSSFYFRSVQKERPEKKANRGGKRRPTIAAGRASEISHIIAILHQWGIHTLGELAALERDQLAARLGPAAVRLWEQANGRATRLLQLVRPAEVFAEQIEFEHEIETAEPLLFVLRRFLEQLTLRLGALYLVAHEITLRLIFADKSRYEHRFHIPDPTNSVEILFRLLQTHLESFQAEHPIVAVGLEVLAAQPARQQFHFFETPLRDPSRLHETLTRLTGLLGKERVGRPVREDSHRPDAFHLKAFSWELPSSPNELTPMIGPALRRFRTEFLPSFDDAVVAQQGPYFVSGDWWDEKKWQRTEWDLELEDGMVCRCQERGDGWEMEGIYD